jgi:regulator of protease activity HflC (stomatin/prohibitin superfamily)
MTDFIRRVRGLAIAFVVLALSAGAVFASAPRFSPAADTEQRIEQPDGDPAATEDTNSPEDADADADEGEDGDLDADADAGEAAENVAGENHGALVSEAAHASLDPRFDNRGEWVSCVAKLDKSVTSSTVDWLQVTEDCATAAEAKDAAKDAASATRAEAKATRDAARAEAKATRDAARAEAKATRDAARAEAKANRQAAKGSKGHGKPQG